MGKVTDFLISQISKQLEKKGIVVWYDPQRHYAKTMEDINLPGVPLLKFEDSFFRLRAQADPYLEFVDEAGRPRGDCSVPPKLVIYVPMDRRETGYALVELEMAGVVMEPGGHSLPQNTRLRVIADQVFKKIAPGSVHEIGRQVDEGLLTLEDLDRLAEEAEGVSTAAIKLIFGTTSPMDVALAFAASDAHDEAIKSKKALIELSTFIREQLGFDLQVDSPSSTRRLLRRNLFVTDLLAPIPVKKRPSQLASITIPESEIQIEKVRTICQVWRNRMDYRESYEDSARTVETDIGLGGMEFSVEDLLVLETFPFIEKHLLLHAEESILNGNPRVALDLITRRKNSFWCLQDHTLRMRWNVVEKAALTLELCSRISAEIKGLKRAPEAFISRYVQNQEPWCLLDTHHRHMESRYSAFDLVLGSEHQKLEQVITLARKEFTLTQERCIEAFSSSLEEAKFESGPYLSQDAIYGQHVHPRISEKEKIAYILVDALRFEMGRELIEGLQEEFEITLLPAIAQLPAITSVGMASLMPGAEKGIELAQGGGGKLAVRVGKTVLRDRASRVKYFSESVGTGVLVLKLNDLIKPSRKRQKDMEAAGVLLVTSQEIDRRGEETDEDDEARIYMDEVLEKLRTAIRNLGLLGFPHLVVAADHGHLFGETVSSGMKMDSPGGKTVELHRRVWIGKGGAKADGFLRVGASQLGVGGELEFAFPRSLSCFKSGGSEAYFHGGMSLQEMVIPVILLTTKKVAPPSPKLVKVKVTFGKKKITNRFFSVAVNLTWDGMFGPDEVKVRIEALAATKKVGAAAMAVYGFDEGTREITLKKDEENPVTMVLSEVGGLKTVTIRVLDSLSQVELARLDDMPVDIAI